ncbi:MAG: type II secretion system F family protein [Thermogemmata sp.]|nr:type II secretion system F family protein [Thermogemmata sp.]
MNDELFIPVLVGILVIGAVTALFMALQGGRDTTIERRLDRLVGRNRHHDSSADILLKQALMEADKQNLLESLIPSFINFTRLFEQADCNIKPSVLFGISLLLGLVGAALSLWMLNIYVLPMVVVLFSSLPWIWLYNKRAARLKKFAAQLPDAMELIARALRAGHSLVAGLDVVAEEMPDPIAKEFARVYEEQNMGIPLEKALENLCMRVPNLDLRFFATSVIIQRQTGGDLAEILDRIGYIIRERFKILGQVKALTAEGRLSGIVLIALPIGLFFLMLWMKPDYIRLLWTDPMGIRMSVGAIVLMILGAFAIKKIVDIKV